MGRGGARQGSGRKPNALRALKRIALRDAAENAEEALGLCISIVRETSLDPRLRLSAATEVMDRVWGKARQPINQTIDININDARDRLAHIIDRHVTGIATPADSPGIDAGGLPGVAA